VHIRTISVLIAYTQAEKILIQAEKKAEFERIHTNDILKIAEINNGVLTASLMIKSVDHVDEISTPIPSDDSTLIQTVLIEGTAKIPLLPPNHIYPSNSVDQTYLITQKEVERIPLLPPNHIFIYKTERGTFDTGSGQNTVVGKCFFTYMYIFICMYIQIY
jgi:hypothetical protein